MIYFSTARLVTRRRFIATGSTGVVGISFLPCPMTGAHHPTLLIMCPHPDNFHGLDFIQNLINQSMLDIDSSGTCTVQVAQKFFVGWRIFVGIFFEDFEQTLGLGLKSGVCDLLCILLGLLGRNQSPVHHSSSSSHSSIGLLMPSWMDSRIPGIEVRYNVS